MTSSNQAVRQIVSRSATADALAATIEFHVSAAERQINRHLLGFHNIFGSGTGFQLTAFNRHLIRLRNDNAFRVHQFIHDKRSLHRPRNEHVADVDPASFAPQ